MARYEFRCPSCDEVFEKTKPMSQSAKPDKCPNCSAKSERIPSTPAVIIIN